MSKRGNLTNSGALSLQSLRFVSFSQAATGSFVSLGANFTPVNITVLQDNGTGKYGGFYYQFDVASAVLPEWVQPGVGLKIVASVTISGTSYDVSGYYIVDALDPSGHYFQVRNPSGRNNAASFTQTLVQTALDSGSGAEGTPLVSLITQFQKAMFQASAGTVLLAPSVDASGNAPYSISLTPLSGSGAEYEITAPWGAKFDLADWSIKESGSGTLTVRFA
jgi:hypothetical protein